MGLRFCADTEQWAGWRNDRLDRSPGDALNDGMVGG
jgi:hypothetical protein